MIEPQPEIADTATAIGFRSRNRKRAGLTRPRFLDLLVGARRFELPTPCTPCKCATRLRYAPTKPEILTEERRLAEDRQPNIFRMALISARSLPMSSVDCDEE